MKRKLDWTGARLDQGLPHQLGLHVFLEVRSTQPSVPIIGDVASVHDFAEQIAQILPGHLGVGLQVVVQHVDADGQVAVVEGVHAVPALRAELPPLCDHRVEVAEREHDRLEFCFFCAAFQRRLIEVVERFVKVRVHPRWRLVGDLDAVLEKALWR